jgi:hypothetical protein
MGPILPIDVVNVDEPEINLMDEGCSLEGMTCLLRSHVPASEVMKLLVDERYELFQGNLVSFSPCQKKTRDFMS